MGGREGQPVADGRRVVFAPVVRHRLGGLISVNRQDHFFGRGAKHGAKCRRRSGIAPAGRGASSFRNSRGVIVAP
jgi:hypothetical protein